MKMTVDGEQRCVSWLRLNRELLLALLVCLIAICKGIDSRSISELLSDLEMEDDSQFLPQQLTSSDSGREDFADDYDDLANILAEPLPKRAPWATYDVSVDSLRQKLLRSKMFNNRQKYASSNHGVSSTENFSELSSKDAFSEGYIAGWLSAKAQLQGDGQREVDGASERGAGLAGVLRRLDKREDTHRERETRLRSTSSIHPVYLGMGQETANAALSTFASLLAEEEKRKNPDSPSNPVRFIGKRYLTDE